MSKFKPKIIAIDGPAGSGKSTIAKLICEKLGWTYVSSGVFYRAVGIMAKQNHVNLMDESALGSFIDEFGPEFRWAPESGKIFFKGNDITVSINSKEGGDAASLVAKLPLVRKKLLPMQRNFIQVAPLGVIMDGRDIGTVVFPDANLKVFLTASLEERAKRRLSQLQHEQKTVLDSLSDIMKNIALRDKQDSVRDVAPLKMAEDAVLVDTTSLSIDQVVEKIISLTKERKLITSS